VTVKTHKLRFIGIGSALGALVVFALLAGLAFNGRPLPQVVDDVRSVVGPAPVAFVENVYYDLLDQFQRWTFSGRTTPGFWTPVPVQPGATSVPSVTPLPVPPSATALASAIPLPVQSSATPTPSAIPSPTVTGAPSPPPTPTMTPAPLVFAPRDLPPLYPALAAPGEGAWVPLPNAFDPAAPPLMYKTFLHPDPQRPYARVAIVAMDATRLRLHTVAGTVEPASTANVPRPGLIPQADLASLVATFNGGFKAMHGHFGMMVNGQTILPPQPNSDTIALYQDGSVRIAPWSALADTLPQMQSFRQTPPYLVANGTLNPGLLNESSQLWGAYVDGNTVIWRSALGLSADGRTLYYAAGESLTARRLAEALLAVGASDVAQLDVNQSFERFLTYAPPSGNFNEQALLSAMNYQPGMYVAHPAPRDFFYLTLAPGGR
jgi:hypothetical protein